MLSLFLTALDDEAHCTQSVKTATEIRIFFHKTKTNVLDSFYNWSVCSTGEDELEGGKILLHILATRYLCTRGTTPH